jgi:hypothetical protein
MTFGKIAAAALALSVLAGCVVHDRETVGAADPHRTWWSARHGQEAYDRNRAEREHREYCGHTPDRSCEGWH